MIAEYVLVFKDAPVKDILVAALNSITKKLFALKSNVTELPDNPTTFSYVIPAAPVAPVAPVTPVAPVAPVGPWGPVGPAGP